MTKAEERKALDRIRKIVAECGADSYIATALDGALELAEQNIEEDAAYSTRYYIDKFHAAADDARKAKEEADKELQKAKESAADWEACAGRLKERWRAADEAATKNWNAFREQEDKAASLEQEVMKLKAMLFDYMVAERK